MRDKTQGVIAVLCAYFAGALAVISIMVDAPVGIAISIALAACSAALIFLPD